MTTTKDCMNLCVSAHMDCIKRWVSWEVSSHTHVVSSIMCAMAYDYIARGDY